MQALPVFTFANQAGMDMLETTLVALQDITLEKILDDHGRKALCSEFTQIMQQVLDYIPIKCVVGKPHNILGLRFCYSVMLRTAILYHHFRVSHVFKAGFASRAWGGLSHMRGQWHGR